MKMWNFFIMLSVGCAAQTTDPDPGDNTPSTSADLILFAGNSLTHGTTTPEDAYPTQTMHLLNVATPWQNLGHSGETTPQMQAEASTLVDVQFDLTRPVVIVWEGTNDLETNGATPQVAFQHLADYCGARRAVGFRVIVLSILPVWAPNWAGFNVRQAPTNELLRAHWNEFADAFVDVGALSQFQAPLPYYLPDELHLTREGYGVIASAVAPVLQTIAQ